MHALCMAVEHERQHQETICYMLAQQRKADAAAAAAGHPAELAPSGSTAEAADGAEFQPLALCDSANAVVPFYLQQCSYAGASTAAASTAAASTAAAPAAVPASAVPATPAKAERLPGRLASLGLQSMPVAQPAQPKQLGSCNPEEAPADFVHIPGGEVRWKVTL